MGWDARQIPGFCSEDNNVIYVAIEYLLFLNLLVLKGMDSREALSWFNNNKMYFWFFKAPNENVAISLDWIF